MIKVTDIHKRFGKQEVLKGIDLDVAKGEVVVLLGPSGSGKTTFLRCLNFLERADQGVIQLGETTTTLHKASKKEILTHQRQTAMVFQNYALFQNKTAKENIMMPLIVTKKQSKKLPCEQQRLCWIKSVCLNDKIFILANCQVDNNSVSGSPVRWR